MCEQNVKRGRVLAVTATLVAVSTYGILLGDPETITLFAGGEMILEAIGALCFLVASVLYLMAWIRLKPGPGQEAPRVRRSYLLLCLLFFAACGEETSWGIPRFGDPGREHDVNVQDEFNIHNLWFLDSYDAGGGRKRGIAALVTANRLFDYFMLTFFLVVPFGHRWNDRIRGWISRLGIPKLPGLLGVALAVNFILTVVSEVFLVDSQFMHRATSEIREFNYAALCLAGSFWFMLKERS